MGRNRFLERNRGTSTSIVFKLTLDLVASKILNWRQTIIGSEDKNGWIKNSRNIWEFSWMSLCYNIQGQFIGNLTIYYADQNPKGKSKEARFVSSGKWKTSDAGWLWTIFKGQRIWLAKATPEGAESVLNGYMLRKDKKKLFVLSL